MGVDQPAGGPPPGMSLFAWVKASLRDSIARGEYAADQPFVTQRQIVERFGVSTTTAVRALNDLVADGLVVRRRGRGTFVADAARRDASARRRSSARSPSSARTRSTRTRSRCAPGSPPSARPGDTGWW